MKTDKILHFLVSYGITLFGMYSFQNIHLAVGLPSGLSVLKEVFDWLFSKLPESWKKIIRKSKVFSCSGWSIGDLIYSALGIIAGVMTYFVLAIFGVR